MGRDAIRGRPWVLPPVARCSLALFQHRSSHFESTFACRARGAKFSPISPVIPPFPPFFLPVL